MHFTFRQLEVFVWVARSENISRAAEQLCLSQSAVSGALSELEKQFSVQLFDRIGKRLRLNELGHALLPRAVELLDRANGLEQLLRAGEAIGPLAVGATLTLGNYLLPSVLTEYMRAHPHSQVRLDVANTRHIVDKIAGFELDIALIEDSVNHPALLSEPWGGDSLVAFCAPTHPLAQQGRLSERDFSEVEWILRERGSGTRAAFDRACAMANLDIEIRLELEHTEGIKRAVESGLGVGCISKLALREAFRRGSLVQLETPYLDLHRRFCLIRHRDKYLTPGLQHFLDLCRQALAEGIMARDSGIP